MTCLRHISGKAYFMTKTFNVQALSISRLFPTFLNYRCKIFTTLSLNEEVNCTKPSSSLSVPCLCLYI